MGIIHKSINDIKTYRFLFEELVKRDFKQKYKRTVLGMIWSIMSPLLTLLVLKLVFGHYFGGRIEHYTTYLFCGNLLFTYYGESTKTGMRSLLSNAKIFTKVNIPKYLFLLSCNISSLFNFLLTLILLFIFAFFDDITFGSHMAYLVYPVTCLVIFNIGVGGILSALYVFFRDISYLYDAFKMLLMYMSAIFYNIAIVPADYQPFFMLNPVYVYISYFRAIMLEGAIPDWQHHFLCAFYAVLMLSLGILMYKKYNHKFLYYV